MVVQLVVQLRPSLYFSVVSLSPACSDLVNHVATLHPYLAGCHVCGSPQRWGVLGVKSDLR